MFFHQQILRIRQNTRIRVWNLITRQQSSPARWLDPARAGRYVWSSKGKDLWMKQSLVPRLKIFNRIKVKKKNGNWSDTQENPGTIRCIQREYIYIYIYYMIYISSSFLSRTRFSLRIWILCYIWVLYQRNGRIRIPNSGDLVLVKGPWKNIFLKKGILIILKKTRDFFKD